MHFFLPSLQACSPCHLSQERRAKLHCLCSCAPCSPSKGSDPKFVEAQWTLHQVCVHSYRWMYASRLELLWRRNSKPHASRINNKLSALPIGWKAKGRLLSPPPGPCLWPWWGRIMWPSAARIQSELVQFTVWGGSLRTRRRIKYGIQQQMRQLPIPHPCSQRTPDPPSHRTGSLIGLMWALCILPSNPPPLFFPPFFPVPQTQSQSFRSFVAHLQCPQGLRQGPDAAGGAEEPGLHWCTQAWEGGLWMGCHVTNQRMPFGSGSCMMEIHASPVNCC